MREITLYIETPDGQRQTVSLDGEITIGRTPLAKIVVNDASLSRVHATVWREDETVWIADENSTNGTFVNGERVFGERKLNDGDEMQLGFETRIYFKRVASSGFSGQSQKSVAQSTAVQQSLPAQSTANPKAKVQNPKPKIPIVPLIAGISFVAIIFFALLAILVAKNFESGNKNGKTSPTPIVSKNSLIIPTPVIDPLGGEDPDDLDDLIGLFEVDDEVKAEDLSEVKSTVTDESDIWKLDVPVAFWQQQKNLAFAPREGATGINPGLTVLPELRGDGVIKQKLKLGEMMRGIPPTPPYQQPMDFADLAEKRIKKELVELPMATESFFLDVGGSASEGPFTSFSFNGGDSLLAPGSPKYNVLQQLADNFDGQKYDLNNPRDRKQMRIRLLRMFHPRARAILKELADAYFGRFKRPLRVTSLTRSMDYQISLNKTNANSFMVRGPGSLPPHTSGCAFDLARKHMNTEEQNFVIQKLADMEKRGILDALIEYNVNACFHIFIYPDGKPPGK